jgi:uncharacterized protein (TIGR00266 family)
MQFEILHRDANPLVLVRLSEGEWLKAEAGALVAKSASIHIEGITEGGAVNALKRSLLGGERFFFQTLRALAGGGHALLAPPSPGELYTHSIKPGEKYHLESGSFLASIGDVHLETKLQNNPKALITGVGLFSIEASGQGDVILNAFGGLHEVTLEPQEEYSVDSGHLIMWSADIPYQVEKAGATWISSAASGELTLCRFTGPARIWLQTRNPYAFGQWLRKYVSAG